MNSRVSLSFIAIGLFIGPTGFLCAQSPAPVAPPPPPLLKDKAAAEAAAVQAPRPMVPPPIPASATIPAQIKPLPAPLPPVIGAPPKPQPPVPALPPALKPAGGMSKAQALEAATKSDSTRIEAPRIPTPSDKIPVVTSTSASGQFRVHGNDLKLRSRMSSYLDEIARELRAALKDGEAHGIPVNVRLSQGEEATRATSAGAPPVGIQITEVEGGGFYLQMDIREVPALKLAEIRRETVRILLAERILRGHQSATPPQGRLLLPDWVFTGVLQTLDFRAAERPVTMFAAIFKSGKIYGIEEIIESSPTQMDNLSRAIYETSCGALIMALIEQPDGSRRFNQFLNKLAVDPKPERELLTRAFPGFAASASSLNKWWSLQLASLARRRAADPLNADETLRALEGALTIRYIAKAEDVPKDIKKRPFEMPEALFTAPPRPSPSASASAADASPPTVAEKSADKKPAPQTSAGTSSADSLEKADETKVKQESAPWLRYLTFGLMGGKKNEPQADEASQDAPKAKPNSPEADKAANKVAEKAPSVPEKTTDQPKADPKDAPKEEPKSERSSLLNPLNWFRSAKKPAGEEAAKKADQPASEPAAEKPKADEEGKKSALWMEWLPTPVALVSWHLQPLEELGMPSRLWEARHALLDFLKRKKPGEAKAKEEAPKETASAPAPSPAKKKAAAKPDPKTPPRTTNPNAKPAAKPIKPADGSPRTTNPLAKPVPLPKPPGAATTTPDDEISILPPGTQWVEIHLEDYRHILKHPDRAKILEKNIVSLRALEQQASILMRPVILGYLSIVLDLREGKTKDIDKRLADLRLFATLAAQRTKAVRDYLDYYEANETERLSGAFDDFLDLPNIIQRELPPREDPIARYLDAVDKEFSK